jgi:hypothetical protein
MARNVARSMIRVLRPGGAVIWYDIRYPNPWNHHLRALTKGRIRRLFRLAGWRLASVRSLRSHHVGLL